MRSVLDHYINAALIILTLVEMVVSWIVIGKIMDLIFDWIDDHDDDDGDWEMLDA